MWSATCELNLGFICLLLVPVSPKMRVRGLLSRSCRSLEELDSLSGGSEKELVQLVDRRMDGSAHIFHPLSAAREFSQVDTIVSSDGHRLFPRAMFRDLIRMEVVHVLLTALFRDCFGSMRWCIGVLSVRPGSSGNFR